jgi:pimeloyl-ACP methyl ester carboxylesterase
VYEQYKDIMFDWMAQTRKIKYIPVSIKSYDGLNLTAKYYEYKKGAPIELMLHGYRGNSERDLCGGIQRCFALERNVLLVDLRASGDSDGHIITFGLRESKDCLAWIDYIIQRFGKDSKIILTGVSMGATTVLLTAGNKLPKNVVGVLADSGYTTAKDIIKKVIKQLHLPVCLLYPFVWLGAKIYGGFDINKISALDSIKNCQVPVMLFHGESDDFVPCDMSRQLYQACTCKKHLLTIPGAGHGLGFLVDKKSYFEALNSFAKEWTVDKINLKEQ